MGIYNEKVPKRIFCFKFLEKIKKFLLPRCKEVVEDFETNIIHETLHKFQEIHALKDEMKNFLPESGKSRAERALNFLTFVCKHDEYIIELENVLRKNNMDYMIPEEKMEEESVLEGKEPQKLINSAQLYYAYTGYSRQKSKNCIEVDLDYKYNALFAVL